MVNNKEDSSVGNDISPRGMFRCSTFSIRTDERVVTRTMRRDFARKGEKKKSPPRITVRFKISPTGLSGHNESD